MILMTLAFVANTLITFTVANAIRRDTRGMRAAFGPDTPARRILACVYGAIGLISFTALVQLALGNGTVSVAIAQTLFPLQIIYKLLTAVVIGPRHPVVMANLGVVVLLTLALWVAV